MFGARDWFGIKPLYTYSDERGHFFASEKKSLLAVAAGGAPTTSIDQTALQHYLTLQYVPEPASMHTTIRRLESGTSFTLRPGEAFAPKRYFHPDFAIKATPEPEKLYREITEALEDSVAKHMRRRRHGRRRSSPAASTRPSSPRWPSGTTRSCSRSRPASSARGSARSTWPPSRPRRSASSTSSRSSPPTR